jgi:predicted nucleotidyltransferase
MNKVYEILYGSHAYGTATEDSDRDIRGIYLPTIDECLSMTELKDYVVNNDKEDTVFYPLQKFFKLCMKCNPSVLEWLYIPEDCIIHQSAIAYELIGNRKMFLSKEIYNRFKGFATSEYYSLDKLGNNIGAKRKEEVLKYGYSPKNAMHMIRLLEEGIELLSTQHLTLPRENSGQLRMVKSGVFLNHSDISKVYYRLCDELDEAYAKSTLPSHTNFEELDSWMISIIKRYSK